MSGESDLAGAPVSAPAPLWSRRSLRWFLLISFGIPWLGWTIVAVTGVGDSALGTALFYTGDFMTVGGFVATYVAAGRPGVLGLFKRYIQVSAPLPWALAAMFLPFIWMALALLTYGLTHDGIGRVVPAGLLTYVTGAGQLIAFTTGPFGEEAGWRGFLLPRLMGRYSPIVASLVLGLLWSAWHYPLYYGGTFASVGGTAKFTFDILCYSILLTVLWAHTRGSVFWAIILHWTINVTANVVGAVFPDIRPPVDEARWLLAGSLAAVTAAVVTLVGPRRLRDKIAETRARLGAESIDADRTR